MNLGWVCNHPQAKTQQIFSLLTKVKDCFLINSSGVMLYFSVQSPEVVVLTYFILSFYFYYCFLERGFAVLIIQPFWKSFFTIKSYYSLFDYLICLKFFPFVKQDYYGAVGKNKYVTYLKVLIRKPYIYLI